MFQTDRNIRVLVIDDDLADRELTRYTLSKSDPCRYDTTFSTCLTDAEPLLQSDDFDVLLLDLGLPESYGKATLQRVRQMNETIPIVVLSDLSDETTALQCLNEGAQDYLFKSHLALETLGRSVRYAIQRQQQQQEIQTTNELLEQRNDELARMCDTAQRFVDNVSHEFRTPLTVITEYVSLLLDGVVGETQLDAEQQRFLAILADRANDLNTMVDDMLDVSKLEAGLLSTWRKTCRFKDILHHLQPALMSKAAIQEVQLTFDVPADLPELFCDDEKLGRCLINLVVNAIKFSGQPGEVVVSARANDARKEVVISITDNGSGIEPEDQQKIFGRFRQLDRKLHTAQKGFGLGLSIANELVELNLGQMSLASEPGQGSTFSFTVPTATLEEIAKRFLQQIQQRHVAEGVALYEIGLPAEFLQMAEDVDAFLNFAVAADDLLFRSETGRWICLVPGSQCQQNDFESRLQRTLTESNRNRPGHLLPGLACENRGFWQIGQTQSLLETLHEKVHPQEVSHV